MMKKKWGRRSCTYDPICIIIHPRFQKSRPYYNHTLFLSENHNIKLSVNHNL